MAMVGDGPGCEVLSEGMAHFSTLLLVEKMRGERQRQSFAKQMEARYGRLRQKDSERALVKIDGKLPGDTRIWYDKGGWALWMLHRFMGEERGLAAVREYMAKYRDTKVPASLEDYLSIQRSHAADTTAFDAFTKQWFFGVVAPKYLDAQRTANAAVLVKDGDGWKVTGVVHNVGDGRMTIDVAAAAGVQWPEAGKKAAPWKTERTTITIGAGERVPVALRCAFRPEKLVVDPDVRVLMLERNKAEVKLAPVTGTIAMR